MFPGVKEKKNLLRSNAWRVPVSKSLGDPGDQFLWSPWSVLPVCEFLAYNLS